MEFSTAKVVTSGGVTEATHHAAATSPDPEAADEQDLKKMLKNMREISKNLFFQLPSASSGGTVAGEVVEYFYLGDLIDVVAADVLADDPSLPSPISTDVKRYSYLSPDIAEKIKIILGDIVINDPLNGDCIRISLADIPISVLTFTEFFFKKVIKARKDHYGFMHFVRDVINDLVVVSLGEGICPGNRAQRLVQVRNNFVSSPSRGGTDPLHYRIPQDEKDDWIGQLYSSHISNPSNLFFPGVATAWTPTSDMYHYMVIYASPPKPDFKGNQAIDRGNGIHHIHFARDRGLLKEGNFSKTAAPYLRETRLTSGRFNPIKILSNVFDVTLKMFGNTLFYPGSYVFINPYGLGTGLEDPTTCGSISNIMGLGGYHTVYKVKHYIEAGKFETTVSARWMSSGGSVSTCKPVEIG